MFDPKYKKKLSESISGIFRADEALKIITDTMPTPLIHNFSKFTPTIDDIMNITKADIIDTEKLIEYDNFDLANPTDYSKPNFISSIQKHNKMPLTPGEKKELKALYSKAINPIRLSKEQAYFVEETTRSERWNELRKYNKDITDNDLQVEQMLFVSYLSPEAYAQSFFYHDKYKEGAFTFSDSDINVRPFQKAFLNCNNNNVALLVNRQDGKSTILQIMMTWYMIFRPGFRGFFIAQENGAVLKFIKELFSEDGSTKIHPYITGAGCTPGESFGELKRVGTSYDLIYRTRMPDGTLSNNDSIINMSYARGDKRFTGTTNQGLFFDEIATYEVDPTGIVGPTLDSFKFLAFSFYTTTQRDGGNPFIPIMNRPDVRIFQRNIWFSYYTGSKNDEDLKRIRDKNGGDQLKWQTEYECVIPESTSSVLTLTDLQKASKAIDNKIQAEKLYDSLGKINTKPWELRDERIFEHFNLVEYNIGIDWNQDIKGNFINVVAVVYDKKDESPEKIKTYKYIHYDSYHITGNQYMYNTIVTAIALMDIYNVDRMYADAGYAQAFKQILAISPELHRSKHGRIFFIPGTQNYQASYPGVEFINFQRMIKQISKDNFDTTHESKLRLREGLITTLINLIKKDKFYFSAHESKLYKLAPSSNYSYIADNDIELEKPSTRTSFDEGTRTLNIADQFEPLSLKDANLNSILETSYKKVQEEYTFVDELKNLTFKSDSKKYVSPTKGKFSELEDDRVISLTLALYPSIQKYETYFLEGIEDDEKPEDKKEKESKQYIENVEELNVGINGLYHIEYETLADVPDEESEYTGTYFI